MPSRTTYILPAALVSIAATACGAGDRDNDDRRSSVPGGGFEDLGAYQSVGGVLNWTVAPAPGAASAAPERFYVNYSYEGGAPDLVAVDPDTGACEAFAWPHLSRDASFALQRGADGKIYSATAESGSFVSFDPSARTFADLGRIGYAGGTGGTIAMHLQRDDDSVNHRTSGVTLASGTKVFQLRDGFAPPGSDDEEGQPNYAFELITFSPPYDLVAGELYHIVFVNDDRAPGTNYAGIQYAAFHTMSTPLQPTVSDTDWAMLSRYREGGRWTDWSFDGASTPVLAIDYGDGNAQGVGYIERWLPERWGTISGGSSVRETFTVSGPNRHVSSVSVSLARASGGDDLRVRLEEGDGTLIEEGTIAASSFPRALPDIFSIAVGTRVLTNAITEVRDSPGGITLGYQPEQGLEGLVVEGPVRVGGVTWWKVDYDNPPSGWSDSSFLEVAVDSREYYDAYQWGTYTFRTIQTLFQGRAYHLVLSAPAETSYKIFPIVEGSSYGFSNGTFFADGHAELMTDDRGWRDWPAYDWPDGQPDDRADLQFYFTVVP
jgi:hypothetical protein